MLNKLLKHGYKLYKKKDHTHHEDAYNAYNNLDYINRLRDHIRETTADTANHHRRRNPEITRDPTK